MVDDRGNHHINDTQNEDHLADAEMEDSEDEDDYGRTIFQIKQNRVDPGRRYVFLCPMRLNNQFDMIPQQAKDGALLIFRCSREQVFPASRSVRAARTGPKVATGLIELASLHRDQGGLDGSACLKPPRGAPPKQPAKYSKHFLEWLHNKEKEECVFWYKPDQNLEKMSGFIEEKICPFTERPYSPLLLETEWWRVRFNRARARYLSSLKSLMEVLNLHHALRTPYDEEPLRHDVELDLRSLQELLFQSNPTLEPIASWPCARTNAMRLSKMFPFVPAPTGACGYIWASPPEDLRSAPPSAARWRQAGGRVVAWPTSTRDRLDNLHATWQRAGGSRSSTRPATRGLLTLPPTASTQARFYGSEARSISRDGCMPARQSRNSTPLDIRPASVR
mmetsp:Transcript_60404/g.128023  ORF Transcript_60404/g.128023 Transcript_60404/m.128023 type:complete len:392 (-) Transcript_60404:148-1323(-)